MECKVDYINFSVPTRVPFELGNPENEKNAHSILDTYLCGLWAPISAGHIWEVHEHKGFYHSRYFDTETKISVFVGTVNRHVHVEVGGQALDYIRAAGLYEDFMKQVATRTSRVDFAVDFEDQCSVKHFIGNRDIGRFKAGGDIFSEDGETSYIGSWKAERFARVYRYHEPHPRAKKLRAEVVLRGDYAKQAMVIWIEEGEVAATIAAHKPFGWKHDLWQPSVATTSVIKSHRSDKEGASTLRWLNGDVAACIARLHAEGLLDAHQWFEKYVQPRLKWSQGMPDVLPKNLSSSDTTDEVSH